MLQSRAKWLESERESKGQFAREFIISRATVYKQLKARQKK